MPLSALQDDTQEHHGSPLLCVLVLFILVVMSWLYFAKVEISAESQGVIRPVGEVKIIQSFVNGVVKQIHVQEGQTISQGQRLISLDDTELLSELRQLQQSLNRSRVYLNDYRHLASGTQHQDTLSAFGLSIQNEFLARIAVLEQTIKKRALERSLTQERIAHEARLLALVQEKRDIYLSLDTKDAIPKMETLDLDTRLLELSNRKLTESQRDQTLQEDIASTWAEIALYRAEYMKAVLEQRDAYESEVFNHEQELAKVKSKLSHMTIKSPIAGVVDKLEVNTLGGVVSVSQNLATVVPGDNQLMLETQVKNKDVGFLREGQIASVKLDSFPFAKYGVIEGKVESISPHSLENKDSEMVYTLKLSLSSTHIEAFARQGNEIRSGMTATAEVKTGERRIIEYLLSPIIESVNESLTER